MSITNRVMKASGVQAEGDKTFIEAVYNSATVIVIGVPLYKDVTDAAEWNANYSATQLSPAAAASGGKVLPSTAANVGANPICAGIYQPLNLSDASPVVGQVVRLQVAGVCIGSAQSPAAGSAGTVGGIGITSTAVIQIVPGAAAVTKTLGIFLATKTFIASATQIFAAASAVITPVNFLVFLS